MNEQPLGSEERPVRVAIIGSGPSGFYAAEALQKAEQHVVIDMFEKLPMPFGLVRYGVAPDHVKIKSVTKIYERIFSHETFHFWGNVNVGQDITVDELKQHYDALIVACGAQTDRTLSVPNIDLSGSHAATEFVAWYNGHPDFQDYEFNLDAEVAVIIGHGNVALDVARILGKTREDLADTEISMQALDALGQSQIKDIHLVGRRGPAQATFTNHEIKELGTLNDCDVIVAAEDLDLSAEDQKEIDHPDNKQSCKNVEALKLLVETGHTGQKNRRIWFHFFERPVELLGDQDVEGLVLGRNELQGKAGSQKVVATGETKQIDCQLFIRSIGYYGVPLQGVPFDEKRGVIPHSDGRVEDGVYVVGWIKRGPSGIIGTNKPDSVKTMATLLSDLDQLTPCEQPTSDAIHQHLAKRKVRVISCGDWQKINAEEIKRGEALDKCREKFTSLNDVLAFLG